MNNLFEYPKIKTIFERDEDHKIMPLSFSSKYFSSFLNLPMWILTEKIDGQNLRISFDGLNFNIEGRTSKTIFPANLSDFLSNLEKKFSKNKNEIIRVISKALKNKRQKQKTLSFSPERPLIFFGELAGYKIQKGSKYVNNEKKNIFVLFDIYVNHYFLDFATVLNIGEILKLDCVPLVDGYKLNTLKNGIDLVESGLISTYANFIAEGIVARPMCELRTAKGDRIIAKIKYRDFTNLKRKQNE